MSTIRSSIGVVIASLALGAVACSASSDAADDAPGSDSDAATAANLDGAAQADGAAAGDAATGMKSDAGSLSGLDGSTGADGATGSDGSSGGSDGGFDAALLDAGGGTDGSSNDAGAGDITAPTAAGSTTNPILGPGTYVAYFNAADNVGLASYELWLEGAPVKTLAGNGAKSASSSYNFNVIAGQDGSTLHFEVHAQDTSANTVVTPFTATIGFDHDAPVVSLKSSLASIGPLPTDVTFTVDATDASFVPTIELYKGATLIASSSFSISKTIPLGWSDNGTAPFFARAVDKWGNASAMTELDISVAVAQSWVAPYGSAASEGMDGAIALDPAGNMFVAGVTYGSIAAPAAGNEDAVLQMRDSTGALLWSKQLGTSGIDRGTLVTATSARVYFGGSSAGALLGPAGHIGSGFLIAYDSATQLPVWQKWYSDPAKIGSVSMIAASPDDDLWVVAGLTGANSLTRFDGGGNAQWSVTNIPLGYLAVDASKNVYVFSNTTPACTAVVIGGGGGADGCLTKLDANGNQLWQIAFGGAANDIANSLSIDAAGNVYAEGQTPALSPWVRSFTPAGTLRYFRDLAPMFAEWSTGTASASGEFWVAGTNRASDHPNSQTLTKLDTAGNIVWGKAFGGVDLGNALPSSLVAVDASSNVYFPLTDLGGMFGPGLGQTDAAIVSFTSAGNLR